jgi:hypothetical protein
MPSARASGGIWQTRRIQVPVRATSWGFKSPLAHHPMTERAYSGCGIPVTSGIPTSTGTGGGSGRRITLA